MCGRVVIHSPPSRWVERFDLPETAIAGISAVSRYNVHPVDDPRDPQDGLLSTIQQLERGRRVIYGAYWGPMVRLRSGWKRVINAKLENVRSSPLWRHAWTAGRRALVPVDGYYEWQRGVHPKIPHYITRRDGEMMALAALVGNAPIEPDGHRETTMVIITQPASGAMTSLHHRMPVEVPDRLWPTWLDKATLIEPDALLEDDPSRGWRWWPVSRAVNNPRDDRAEMIQAVDE